MGTIQHDYLVGYRIEPGSSGRSTIHGTALIDSDSVEHELTVCAHPHSACDVGRNSDGDLVWVSIRESNDSSIPLLDTVIAQAERFDPEILPTDIESEHVVGDRQRLVLALKDRLSQRKTLLITAGFVSALLFFLGLSVTSAPHNAANSTEKIITADKTSAQEETTQLSEPTEAAIEFVVSGQVPGLVVPEHATRDSLQATVVSTSGDIVLVDVQAQLNDGLTTFATLLLQKSGTAWRIREVFDPR